MIKIKTTSLFRKSHSKLPPYIVDLFEKKKNIFILYPFHPSLKTHKLSGRLMGLYSFSINYTYRVLLDFINKNTVLFVNVGTHKIYK